ncbi:MAG TPA: UvrB/UvrC motif-containing protein, partial [Acidimicrobiales bacterium]|nr:UvrB/UvrC motif-containing protein [Acidimicrobiales bacterium]
DVLVRQVIAGLTGDPAVLLDPLAARMRALSAVGRYEEAADVRDRAAALSRALQRQRRLDALRHAGRLEVEVTGEGWAVVDGGLLLAAWADGSTAPSATLDPVRASPTTPLGRDAADEVQTIASWLDARAGRIRIVECEGTLASPLPRLPSFEPAR